MNGMRRVILLLVAYFRKNQINRLIYLATQTEKIKDATGVCCLAIGRNL